MNFEITKSLSSNRHRQIECIRLPIRIVNNDSISVRPIRIGGLWIRFDDSTIRINDSTIRFNDSTIRFDDSTIRFNDSRIRIVEASDRIPKESQTKTFQKELLLPSFAIRLSSSSSCLWTIFFPKNQQSKVNLLLLNFSLYIAWQSVDFAS